jgi:hypothetical protein
LGESAVSTLKQNYRVVAAVVLVLGIILIGIAEAPSMDWLRVFGAGFITLGAMGLGVYVGLNPPGQSPVADRVRTAKIPIGLVLAATLFAPALLALIAALFGGLTRDVDGGAALQFAGGLILVLMLVATLVTAAEAAAGIRRGDATRPPAEEDAA